MAQLCGARHLHLHHDLRILPDHLRWTACADDRGEYTNECRSWNVQSATRVQGRPRIFGEQAGHVASQQLVNTPPRCKCIAMHFCPDSGG